MAELFVAFELEKNYTKDEILELYVNTIYFGSGYYCVYDAAQGYFEKEPEQMNDYESTLLAGIPNAPSVYALTKPAGAGGPEAADGGGMYGGSEISDQGRSGSYFAGRRADSAGGTK